MAINWRPGSEEVLLSAHQVAKIEQNLAQTRGSTGFFDFEFEKAVEYIERIVKQSRIIDGVLNGTIGIDVRGSQVVFFERKNGNG